MEIRAARPEDVAGIAAWTQDTFTWGDYIPERLPGLIDDPDTGVLVAEEGGSVVATISGRIVGPGEAWAQGARVHPDHRRKGIGTVITEALFDWLRERGASVVRLCVDEGNEAAQGHVTGMGLRRVSGWVYGERAIGAGAPVPAGNGGRRVPPPERLTTAHSAEAEPAFLSWSAGELSRAARGLLSVGWTWRRMTVDHLVVAAKERTLFEGRPGWAVAVFGDDAMRIDWVETGASDADAMVLALIDLAVEAGVGRVGVMIPAVDWLADPFREHGFEMHPEGIFARAL